MEKMVEVSEQEVRIDFELGCKCRANIHLRSLSSTTPIAFKVQTSSPQKFLVNPPSGLISPLSHTTFQIILKPQSQLPSTFPRSATDRFLVKTALAPDLMHTSSEFINSWFSSTPHLSTHNLKLKVAFVGHFLLRYAVSNGDCVAVGKIIKLQRSIVAELPAREAESLLRKASELDNSDDMFNLLFDAGLKTEARARFTEERWTSRGSELHVAAAFNRTEEVSRLIREGGCESLDCKDKEGRTPLHVAAGKGHLNVASLLVSAGVDVNVTSIDGRSALYRSAANGNRKMVELLMENGADPTIRSVDRSRSALDVARDKGYKEVVEILERGAAVLQAARRGELKRLESLLDKDASVNYSDQYGLTALHAASIKGHKDAVMMLVEFGAELECQDLERHTPLHLAVEGGSVETVEVLINRGANVNAKTKMGATPLHIAKVMGYEDISQFLVSKGASSLPPSPSSSSSML